MWKKIALGLSLSAVLVMTGGAGGGCTTSLLGKVASNEKGLTDDTVLDERAMIVAEAAVFGANAAADAAVDSGLLTPGSETAVKVADGLAVAYSTLQVARSAYAAGDADKFNARVVETQATVEKVWTLIHQVQAVPAAPAEAGDPPH